MASSSHPSGSGDGSAARGHTTQRRCLKIRIVTWNMAESIPKGDLSVLLGNVSPQQQQQGSVVDGEVEVRDSKQPADERVPPPLPLDDQHPFHLFVVAAQECPFGDAGRLATGVGMAGEMKGIGRTKSKAHKDKTKAQPQAQASKSNEHKATPDATNRLDVDKSDASAPPSLTASPRTPFPPEGADYFANGVQRRPSLDALAPLPPPLAETSKPDRTVRGFGGKPGWSDLCESWLCAASSASRPVKWPSGASKAASTDGSRTDPNTASLAPAIPTHLLDIGRSASTSQLDGSTAVPADGDLTPRAEDSQHAPSSGEAASQNQSPEPGTRSPRKKFAGLHLHIPTSPSKKTFLSPLPVSGSTPTAKSPGFSSIARLQSNASNASAKTSSPAGPPPADETPSTLGPYKLVAKERMMGVYMAVYCWKGCFDYIQGKSKAYVKSGLLAGRVGNKGAVGISVKLGGTRLLFVNAHLAAHEGRIATRLQNIARIKAELDCDTFLPSDDPRNMAEDVTARFDHVFWFGDLNFRIDITRQHADWLLLNKKYEQALEFDQLRKVMREETAFEGFQEAPITFPPTYKFDILSTLKKVKRRKTIGKRILHRRQTSKDKDPDQSLATTVNGCEGTTQENALGLASAGGPATLPASNRDLPELAVQPSQDPDDASSLSSGWGSMSSLNIHYAFDSESEDNLPATPSGIDRSCNDGPPPSVEDVPSIEHEGPAETKEHEKPLLKKVKDLFSSNSDSARSPVLSDKTKLSTSAQPGRSDAQAPAPLPIAGAAGEPVIKVLVEPKHASKMKSLLTVPLSQTKRSITFGSSNGAHSDADTIATGGSKSSQEVPVDNPVDDGGGDPAAAVPESVKQVYDTSAKQRVPSWCDRVLWRSTVPIEDDPEDEEEGSEGAERQRGRSKFARFDSEVLGGRVTQALAHVFGGSPFGGHGAGRPRSRSASLAGANEPGATTTTTAAGAAGTKLARRASRASATPSDDGRRVSGTILTPEKELGGSTDAVPTPSDGAASSSAQDSKRSPIRRFFPSRHRLASRLHLGQRDDGAQDGGGIFKAASASEVQLPIVAAQAVAADTANATAKARQRSISIADVQRPTSSELHNGDLATAAVVADPRNKSLLARRRSTSASHSNTREGRTPLLYTRSVGGLGLGQGLGLASPAEEASSPRRMSSWSWWEMHVAGRLLPSFLSSSNDTAGGAGGGGSSSKDNDDEGGTQLFAHHDGGDKKLPAHRPKRTGPRKGEVQCLVYRSLGDREMVELKARSDHRAVIWVGAVGI